MRWRDLRIAAATGRREFQLSTRSATFWSLAGAGGLYALWRGTTPQSTAALACYQVVQLATVGLGVVAVLLGGAAAGRDARERSSELVLSKPTGTSAGLLLARFAGAWLSLVTVVAVMVAAVFVGQLITRGTPWNISAYGNGVARAMAPLAVATALGFTLATLFTPLAAGVAAFCWIAIPLAHAHVPAIFDLTVSQYWPLAVALTGALLALSVARQGIAVAGSTPARRTAGWAAAALFAAAGLSALLLIGQGEDSLLRPYRVLEAISGQTATEHSPAPGFWLLDARKRLVGLSDFQGRPIVLVFWAPADAVSVHALPLLRELARRHAKEGLRCIAVCVDKDSATLAPFSREVGSEVVMLWDRGRHFNAAQVLLDSPAATAYGVEQVPAGFVLDRDHTIVSASFSEVDSLEMVLRRYLVGQ